MVIFGWLVRGPKVHTTQIKQQHPITVYPPRNCAHGGALGGNFGLEVVRGVEIARHGSLQVGDSEGPGSSPPKRDTARVGNVLSKRSGKEIPPSRWDKDRNFSLRSKKPRRRIRQLSLFLLCTTQSVGAREGGQTFCPITPSRFPISPRT